MFLTRKGLAIYFKGKYCRRLVSAQLSILFFSSPVNSFIMVASGLGPTALAVTWSEFAAGTVLMALRIYTNGFIIRRWNPDFWWASVSYVSMSSCLQAVSNLADLRDSLIDLPHYRRQLWRWRTLLAHDLLINP